ncbi:protein LDOC1-like [Saccopteryx bilineata]|uniref:protein LDOC1-like n=1 Tax=Saccopteryx bilineata TaxID=59482 RepID=UPI00338DA9E3
MDPLAVVMQDLLTQNHAFRRENNELMDQVRRLLCEKASLLAPVRPACPLAFPETFQGDSARLPEFWTLAASYLRLHEARFSSDNLQVASLISRLSGPQRTR